MYTVCGRHSDRTDYICSKLSPPLSFLQLSHGTNLDVTCIVYKNVNVTGYGLCFGHNSLYG